MMKSRWLVVCLIVLMMGILCVAPLIAEEEEGEKRVTPITNEYRVAPMNENQRLSTVVIEVEKFADERPEAEINGTGSGFMSQESSEALSKDTLVDALQNVMANEFRSTAGVQADTTGTKNAEYRLAGEIVHFLVTKDRELINMVPYVSNLTNLFVGEPIYHTAQIDIELIDADGDVIYDSSYITSFETKQTPGLFGVRNLTPYQTVEREIHILMDDVVTQIVLDIHRILERRRQAFVLVREPIYEARDGYWEKIELENLPPEEGWAVSN